MLDLAAANWNTSLGAACFLACAVGTLLAEQDGRGQMRRGRGGRRIAALSRRSPRSDDGRRAAAREAARPTTR